MNNPLGNPFVSLKERDKLDLPATDRLPAAGHLWSQPEIDALILAWAARRPLLVRGEAGSGKSQIARAAAKVLGSETPLVEVIHPRFEALDLLYYVDSVERLADAQLKQLDITNEKYVKRGRLWEAFALADTARKHAADQVLDDRKEVAKAGYPPVGLAEYIDLLTALHELTRESPEEERAAVQINWLQRLSVYALVKNADAMQDRPPRELSAAPAADAVNERS